MSAPITQVREAIADALSDALSIPFVPGRIDGPVQNGDIGCTFAEGDETNETNENFVIAHVRARVLVSYDGAVEPESPPDPSVLEDLQSSLRRSLSPGISESLSAWFYRVSSVEIDHDAWAVEALILVELPNEFDLG